VFIETVLMFDIFLMFLLMSSYMDQFSPSKLRGPSAFARPEREMEYEQAGGGVSVGAVGINL
jgi:hypothetical protein